MAHGVLLHWVLILAAGAGMVAAVQRLGFSPIVGYLAAGFLVGPKGFGWLPDGPLLRILAELGVVLLMFTIGLEFSLSRLLAARRLVLGVGGIQVVATAALVAAGALFAGFSPAQAVMVGLALAMSSTAIVLKALGEQLELSAPHGRLAAGVLLFQDLAAVPALAILPVLAATGGGEEGIAAALAGALAAAGAVLAFLLLLGRYVLPPVLHWVAETRSLELFLLTALLLAFAAAALSEGAGLSPTLGAFMAGALLGETPFRHQLEADIRPFRDTMLGLFFATVGLGFDPDALAGSAPATAVVVAALLIVKPLLIYPLARWAGHSAVDAWRAGIVLAQGGEFGLLLLASAGALGLFSGGQVQPLLAGVAVSMAVAPFLIRANGAIGARLTHFGGATRADPAAAIAEWSREYEGHVILAGYGRLGQNVMQVLRAEGVDALALDLDPERVRQAAAAGEPVLYGNAAQPDILRAAGIDRARALAITIGEVEIARRIAALVREMGVDVPVLARSRRGRDDELLAATGAIVFPEGLETSLAFAGQLLVLIDVPPPEVERRLNLIRAEDYAPLRAFFPTSSEEKAREQRLDYPQQMRAVLLAEGHWAVGRTLDELHLESFDVELVDVRRGALRLPVKSPETVLRTGDVVVLRGRRDALDAAVARLIEGA
ncbi:MAG: potassium transporter Kef [Porticoccaceae bacterium]|nr:MAG: potassium transporter Kef [Porticoccaceae bacterium]